MSANPPFTFDFETIEPVSQVPEAAYSPLIEHGRRNVESGGAFEDERGFHSILSGSVQDERLNQGRPTVIPFVYEGREVDVGEAIDRAIQAGTTWPSADTEEEATAISKAASDQMGRLYPRTSFDVPEPDEEVSPLAQKAMEVGSTGLAGISQMVLNTGKFIWQTPATAGRYSEAASESLRDAGVPEYLNPFAFPAMVFKAIDEGLDIGSYHAAGTGDVADAINNAVEILPEMSPSFARLGLKSEEAAKATAALIQGRPELIKKVATDPEAWAAFIGNGLPTLYMAWKSGGSLSFMGWLEAMDAAGNVEEYEARTGEKISNEQFVMATAAVGATNAFLEKMGLESILGKGTGVLGIIGGFVAGTIGEGGTELLQEITQNTAGLIYDDELRGKATDAIDRGEWEPFLQEMTEGVVPALMGGAGLGGPAGGLTASVNTMAERQNARNGKEVNTRYDSKKRLLPFRAREDITPAEAEELGLSKVEITRDMLDRVGAGEPLSLDEQYTLTNDGYGRFVGAAGSERVVLVKKGMDERRRLSQVEAITLEGDTAAIEMIDFENIEVDISDRETFVEMTGEVRPEPKRSVIQRLSRAAQRAVAPTPAQAEAGNYRKGHVRIQGMEMSIETPKGGERSGVDRSGKQWTSTLRDHYGYIRSTKAKDKDQVDAFIGSNPSSNQVWVVNQNRPETGVFDEPKVMVGYNSLEEARAAYLRNYPPGWKGLSSIEPMTVPQFKLWLNNGSQNIPAPAQQVEEHDTLFKTGTPVTFNYVTGEKPRVSDAMFEYAQELRRLKPQSQALALLEGPVDDVQQDIEPAGNIVRHVDDATEMLKRSDYLRAGTVTLNKPLVIPANSRGKVDDIYDNASWKQILFDRYGKTGDALTQALRNDGYDGIVTVLMDSSGKIVETRDIMVLKRLPVEAVPQGMAVAVSEGDTEYTVTESLPGGEYQQGVQRAHVQVFERAGKKRKTSAEDFVSPEVQLMEIGTFRSGITKAKAPEDVAHIIAPLRRDAQESVMALVTDAKENVIALVRATTGRIDGADAPVSVLTGMVYKIPGAKKVWFAHNHPSGIATQSNADMVVTSNLYKAMQGTGIDVGGMIVVAPQGNATFYDPSNKLKDGDIHMPKLPRTEEISVTQRRFRKFGKPGTLINSPGAAREYIKKLGRKDDFVLMLNVRHQVVGIVPLEEGEIANLRSKDPMTGAGKIMGAVAQMNAPAMMFVTKETSDVAVGNPFVFGKTFDVRVLDVLHGQDLSSAVEMNREGNLGTTIYRSARPTNHGKGMTRAALQDAVRPFYSAFRSAPVVRTVQSVEDLPDYIQQQLRSVNTQIETTGVYSQDAYTDTVWLIANNTRNAQEAIETMIHEIIGHYGLHQTVPANVYDDVMDKVYESFPKEVAEIARIQDLNLADPVERRVAAEEYIAYMSQRLVRKESVPQKIKDLIRRIVQAIRNRLRAAYGKTELFTDAQIWSMIGQSTDYVRGAGGYRRDKHRGLRRHMDNPTYYSQMFNVLADDQAKALSPEQWTQLIETHVRKGRIKREEVDWSGIIGWLEDVTWVDIYRMTNHDESQLPIEVQQLNERKTELENLIRIYKDQKPNWPELTDWQVEYGEVGRRLNEIGKSTPKKISKEAVLSYIQNEGVDVHAYSPGSDEDLPEFNEGYPDETDEPSEDDWYENWDELRDVHWSEYYDDALKEIRDEHHWDAELEASDLDAEELGVEQDDLDAMDLEELNAARGDWDGTSEGDMEDEANERATEAIERDFYDDARQEWLDENTMKRWYSGNYGVTYQSGEYYLEDTEGGGHIGSFNDMDDVNEAIREHGQAGGSQAWKDYTLPGGVNYETRLFKWENAPKDELFQETGHWPDQNWNYFAHARFDERKDLNGKDAILIDEIQSDWHQEIRDKVEDERDIVWQSHGYDPTEPNGGEDYDGTPLDAMLTEARNRALENPAEFQRAKAKIDALHQEFTNEDGVKDRTKNWVSAWNLTQDEALRLRVKVGAASADLVKQFITAGSRRAKAFREELDRGNMAWKLTELMTEHGFSYRGETILSEGLEAFEWIATKDWDGTAIEDVFEETRLYITKLKNPISIDMSQDMQGWSQDPSAVKTKEMFSSDDIMAMDSLWSEVNNGRINTPLMWGNWIRYFVDGTQTYRFERPRLVVAELFADGQEEVERMLHSPPVRTKEEVLKIKTFLLDSSEALSQYARAKGDVALAPFEKTWQTVVIKNMIREGIDRGHDRLFINIGDVHGVRWSGAVNVSAVYWERNSAVDDKTVDMFTGEPNTSIDPTYTLWKADDLPAGLTKTGDSVVVTASKLHSIVGREVAKKIHTSEEIKGTVTEDDVDNPIRWATSDRMKGSREVYDSITVNQINKFLKPFKAKMQIGLFSPQGLGSQGTWTSKGANVHPITRKSKYPEKVSMVTIQTVDDQMGVPVDLKDKAYLFAAVGDDGRIIGALSENRNLSQLKLNKMRDEEAARAHYGVEVWEIEFTPKLREQAQKGFTLFSKRRRGKKRSGNPRIDKALEWADKNIGPQKPRSIEQFQRRANEIIRVEGKAMKMEQALVDQFAGIKWAIRNTYGYDLPAEQSGYKQAHFTTSGDSQMYAFLLHGAPEWRGGITQIKQGTKGLLEVLEPVANHITEWGYWMAARRANRLMGEGRERLFDQETIDGLMEMGDRFPEFQDVADAYAEWKTHFLDWAQEAGIFNAETRPLWDQADYVPFYRVKSDELGGSFSQKAGMGVAGIANQRNPIKRLKGGTDQLGDIIENILINFTHMASTAMKNKAAALTVENLKDSGLIEPVKGSEFMEKRRISEADLKSKLKAAGVDPNSMPVDAFNAMQEMWTINAPQGDDIVTVLVNGKKKYYHVNEETLLRSLTAINEVKFNSLLGRLGMWAPRKAKRLLTSMITLEPGFMVANWFRDVAMAYTNSRHAKLPKPLAGVTGAFKAISGSKEMVSMMAAGGAFYSGYINAMDPGATAKSLRRAMRRSGIRNRVLDAPWKLFELYNDLGAAGENANRIGSAYIPAIKAGASTAEAVWEAKDLMNFAKHGDHAAIQFLIQTVPFMNARIQGLIRYGQRFKEAPGLTFTKSLLYTMAVMAIYLSNKDDDRYKELTEEDKDLNIHFWLNGKHWRLPKAFEVGMLFGTAPERITEWLYSDNDDRNKLAIDRTKFIFDQVFQLWDPVTVVPIPQLFQPYIEAAINYDFFFQGPIVPEYMQDIAAVRPDQVYRPSTSPTARELAKVAPRFLPDTMRNPMTIEHLMRGYFGTLGSYVMMMTDDLVRKQFDYPPRPELRWNQIPVAGRFYRGEEPANRTKYEQIMYEVRNNARQIDRAVTQLQDRELADEVDKFLEEPSRYNRNFTNQDILGAAQGMEAAYNAIRRMRSEVNKIWEDTELSPAEKTRQLNELYKLRNEAAKDAYDQRPGTEPAETVGQLPIGTLALESALAARSRNEAIAFLRQYEMQATADLLSSLPSNPSPRLTSILKEAE